MREAGASSETIARWAQAMEVMPRISNKAHLNLALVAVFVILCRSNDAATSTEWARLHR
jgi:hypothetical protein